MVIVRLTQLLMMF